MKSDNQTTDMFVPNRLEQELNRIAQDVDPPQVSTGRIPREVPPRTIVVRAVEQALSTLSKLGCVYRVRFNNKDYTNGEFPSLKPTRVGTKEYGDRAKYYKPFLKDMKAGDVVDVPFGKFKGQDLQSSIGSWAVTNWGVKTFMTTVNKKKKVVEVLRLL
jgi:hypothetical protein